MCRHLAYLGPAATLKEILADPPHGLLTQSWAPRRQYEGVVNADGFGVGWYADGDPVPARYRKTGPMWADEGFLDVARVTRTRALLAAVRSASIGTTADASAAAPYRSGSWLFSHNGRVEGWPGSMSRLVAALPPEALLQLEARVDSAAVWALVLDRLLAGADPGAALATTVADMAAEAGGRYNLLLTDGATIAATAYGHSLSYRTWDGAGGSAVLVASEPDDADPGWTDVPDGSLLVATLVATAADVDITPLPVPAKPTATLAASAAGAARTETP